MTAGRLDGQPTQIFNEVTSRLKVRLAHLAGAQVLGHEVGHVRAAALLVGIVYHYHGGGWALLGMKTYRVVANVTMGTTNQGNRGVVQ